MPLSLCLCVCVSVCPCVRVSVDFSVWPSVCTGLVGRCDGEERVPGRGGAQLRKGSLGEANDDLQEALRLDPALVGVLHDLSEARQAGRQTDSQRDRQPFKGLYRAL